MLYSSENCNKTNLKLIKEIFIRKLKNERHIHIEFELECLLFWNWYFEKLCHEQSFFLSLNIWILLLIIIMLSDEFCSSENRQITTVKKMYA